MGPKDKDEEIREDFWDYADKLIDKILDENSETIDATYDEESE